MGYMLMKILQCMIDKGEVNKIMTNSFSEYAMLYDKIMLQTSSNA